MWPFKKRQTQLRIVDVPANDISLDQWMGDRNLVGTAQKVLNSAEFKLMLVTLRNESPSSYVFSKGASRDDRAALQARTEGYQICINNLLAMGRLQERHPMPQPNFEPEEIDIEKG